MPTVKKQEMVADLTALLRDSSSAIVTDYRGLTVADIAAVRRSLRERGITYRVIKNRLARIAARNAGLTELDSLLEGPSALAVGRVDEVVLARSFLEAVRPFRTVTVRGGLLRGRLIESAAVERLATLPGRDVLLGQLAGGMVAPLSAMASLLSAPLRNLGYALQQVATQKAAAALAAPALSAPAPPAPAPDATTHTKTDRPAKKTPKTSGAVAEKDSEAAVEMGSETAATSEPKGTFDVAAPEPAPETTAPESASGDAAPEPKTESA